jgi:S-adenosylmethionine:tRNA ribosyltransferase-isomerase
VDRLSDFDYELPEELIAQSPLEDRAASRLLCLDRESGQVQDRHFREVPEILQPGDLLIWNDTRVTARRLYGKKPTGTAVEALLLNRTPAGTYRAMLKPGKRLKTGATIEFENGLKAEVVRELEEPLKELALSRPIEPEEVGEVPLPPYIMARITDPERYQTVYADRGGSAAAPTAGLHFTPELIKQLRAQGVRIEHVTLDVSLDTVRPVFAENLDDHKMHGELCRMPESTAEAIESCQGRIIAVGTTTARTLESFAVGKRRVKPGEQSTSIFIRPGYQWQILDGMFTNFHMPRTTMLMMISALASRATIMEAYRYAVSQHYRFLSFGDSMLIL